ncbi:MAG: hypothetical protein AB1730_24700 [Myxococcota bacterium]|jgi:hypothetical protein
MRHLILGVLLAASTALAQDVSGTAASAPPRASENAAALLSAPQLGHLAVDGRIAFLPRLQLELGGWNLFDESWSGTFLRGGWLGVRFRAFETDGITIDVAARGLAGQEQDSKQAVGGAWLASATAIRVFRWFSVLPDFEGWWLGRLVQLRAANEFRFSAGDWRLSGHGGAQIWVKDGDVRVAPVAELSVGWRRRFRPFDVDISGGLALTRDPSALLGHPVFRDVRDAMTPWGFVRLGFVVN